MTKKRLPSIPKMIFGKRFDSTTVSSNYWSPQINCPLVQILWISAKNSLIQVHDNNNTCH